MDGPFLLGSIVSRSHVFWLGLFGCGYMLREFIGFCRHHPRIRKRDDTWLRDWIASQRADVTVRDGLFHARLSDGRTVSTSNKRLLESWLDLHELQQHQVGGADRRKQEVAHVSSHT